MPPAATDQAIEIWCDGAYSSSDDCGGWAFVIKLPNNPFCELVSGAERATTSQRMEMTALLMALRHIKAPAHIVIHIDSAYVKNCFVRGWYRKWQSNGWRNAEGKPVANRDLWSALIQEMARPLSIKWVKVKGHRGIEFNEIVDRAAVQARRDLAKAA